MMKAIICGGRNFNDRTLIFESLDSIHRSTPITIVVHGGASGADNLAGEWAKARSITCVVVKALWDVHGRAAGPIRNQKMLELNPEMVIAFPGGKGTADMTKRAANAGISVANVVAGETTKGGK